MNLLDKIKKLYKQENYKKFITNLLIILIIGVIIMIAASSFTGSQLNQNQAPNSTQNQLNLDRKDSDLIDNYSTKLENDLEDILSSIKGIGEVKVMITLEGTAERIPALNITETKETTKEEDSEGGTREVFRDDSSKQVVTSNNSGEDSLVVTKEVKPKIQGAIVVAQGVDDPELKELVYRAVKTVLGISGNKVDVFSSN